MKFCSAYNADRRVQDGSRDALLRVFRGFILGAAILSLSGCSIREQTVIPRTITSQQASADGNKFNSGDQSYDADGATKSAHWLERYDALLSVYGKRFTPEVKPGDRKGIIPALPDYRVTAEVSARFTRMNLWKKAEQAP